MTISGATIDNVSLASISNPIITGFGGQTRRPSLGTLSLGVDSTAQQFFTLSSGEGVTAYLFSGRLREEQITSSYSFGLHIGSTSFNLQGSLLFGGYDRARVIGPYTSYNDHPSLQDIQIGVESGGSPFSFQNQTNLLVTNSSVSGTIPVIIDPGTPYISLPAQTCQAITQHLPVYYDQDIKYYIWNTTSPDFQRIVTSPTYLGFKFTAAAGDTHEVTIKVPFALLNLKLEAPILSKGSTKQYFPCAPFTPASGDSYRLGRAFLQAAFVGRSFDQNHSWLAQAPGSGVQDGKADLQEISADDKDLHGIDTDPYSFAKSWEHYWTPLPTLSRSDESSLSTKDSNELKIGAIVGIAIGSAVGVFVVLILGV